MKNDNFNKQNKQDRKFRQQSYHLSSFIGMPMWNGRNPSLSEIREFDRRILEKQALGFEPKRKSVLRHQLESLKLVVYKAIGHISKAENKQMKVANECCG